MELYELKKINDVTIELKADITELLNMVVSAQQMAQMKAEKFEHLDNNMHVYYHEKTMQYGRLVDLLQCYGNLEE